ncbi:MAG: hypothetical protein KF704_09670 [Crocinitomicaceae bacterium]|nr:hypothetical protein [Crocinitomicaceae bacterium]
MQDKSKIILLTILGVGIIVFNSCKNNNQKEESYYRYYSTSSDRIISYKNPNIVHYKDNLYFIGDTIYIGVPLVEDVLKNNKIFSERKGICLINPAEYNLSIDTSTYRFIIEELIASDINHVIAFPKGKYKLPFIEILKLNPDRLSLIDNSKTYIKDDSLVYCIPTNTYIKVNPGEFHTIYNENVEYGKYENIIYYLDTPIDTLK